MAATGSRSGRLWIDQGELKTCLDRLTELMDQTNHLITWLEGNGPNQAWFSVAGAPSFSDVQNGHQQVLRAAQNLHADMLIDQQKIISAAHTLARSDANVAAAYRNVAASSASAAFAPGSTVTLPAPTASDQAGVSFTDARVLAGLAEPVPTSGGGLSARPGTAGWYNFADVQGVSGLSAVFSRTLSGAPDSIQSYSKDVTGCAAELADIDSRYVLLHEQIATRGWTGETARSTQQKAQQTSEQLQQVASALKTLSSSTGSAGSTLAQMQKMVALIIALTNVAVAVQQAMGNPGGAEAARAQGQAAGAAKVAALPTQMQQFTGLIQATSQLISAIGGLTNGSTNTAAAAYPGAVPAGTTTTPYTGYPGVTGPSTTGVVPVSVNPYAAPATTVGQPAQPGVSGPSGPPPGWTPTGNAVATTAAMPGAQARGFDFTPPGTGAGYLAVAGAGYVLGRLFTTGPNYGATQARLHQEVEGSPVTDAGPDGDGPAERPSGTSPVSGPALSRVA